MYAFVPEPLAPDETNREHWERYNARVASGLREPARQWAQHVEQALVDLAVSVTHRKGIALAPAFFSLVFPAQGRARVEVDLELRTRDNGCRSELAMVVWGVELDEAGEPSDCASRELDHVTLHEAGSGEIFSVREALDALLSIPSESVRALAARWRRST